MLAHGAKPVRPKITFDMADGIHTKTIAIRLFDQFFESVRERRAHCGKLRLEIIQSIKLPDHRLHRVIPIAHLPAVVEPIQAIERRRRNPIFIYPTKLVRRAVFPKPRPTLFVAGGNSAEMIEHDIQNDVDAPLMRGFR